MFDKDSVSMDHIHFSYSNLFQSPNSFDCTDRTFEAGHGGWREVGQLSFYCSHNNMEVSALKKVEMSADFTNSILSAVETFRFL